MTPSFTLFAISIRGETSITFYIFFHISEGLQLIALPGLPSRHLVKLS